MKKQHLPLTSTVIVLASTLGLSACMSEGLHQLGDWMAETEQSLFGEDEQPTPPTAATELRALSPSSTGARSQPGATLDLSQLTPEQIAQLQLWLGAGQTPIQPAQAPAAAPEEEVDLAQLMALAMLLSGELKDLPVQMLADGTLVIPGQPGYGQGFPVSGFSQSGGVFDPTGAAGYPQQFGFPQQGAVQGNPGFAGAPGFDSNFTHDTHAYQNPESAYYDPYEAAAELPSSNYSSGGSYSGGGFDD